MTQQNILELARAGDANAIASLMNHQLQPKGVTAKASLKNGCLHIMLEATQVPNQQTLVALMRKGITSLGSASIERVKVYGRQTGEEFPAWSQEFELAGQQLPLPNSTTSQGNKPLWSSAFNKIQELGSNTAKQGARFKEVASQATKVTAQKVNEAKEAISSVSQQVTEKLSEINQETLAFSPYSHIVRTVTFLSNGQTIVSGSDDRNIKLWSWKNRKVSTTLSGHTQSVTSIAISANGKTLASGSEDNTIKLWNVINGQEICTLVGHSNHIQSVAFNRDDLTLASSSCDNIIKVWNLKTRQETITLSEHSGSVRAIAFSSDGIILASGSDDKTIKLWNPKTGKLLRTLVGHSLGVNSIAISHDGLVLVSGSDDRTIKLWNLKTGQLLRTLIGHSLGVSSLAISPNDRMLASGSYDTTIKLWELKTGQLLNTITGHSNRVNTVAFSANGLILASGSADETIKVWSIKSFKAKFELWIKFTVTVSVFMAGIVYLYDRQNNCQTIAEKVVEKCSEGIPQPVFVIAGFSFAFYLVVGIIVVLKLLKINLIANLNQSEKTNVKFLFSFGIIALFVSLFKMLLGVD